MEQTPDQPGRRSEKKQAGQVFVGFAAETEKGHANAVRKLREKSLDLIALNDVTAPGAGFDVDTNQLTLITENGETEIPLTSKAQAAEQLLDAVMRIRTGLPHA